jgi:hypothetical protein
LVSSSGCCSAGNSCWPTWSVACCSSA